MTKLRQDALKSPIYHIIIVTLLAVGFVSLPAGKLFSLFMENEYLANIIGGMILRIILGITAVIFIYRYGFIKQYINKVGLMSIVMILPAILVAINNFPIISLVSGDVKIKKTTLEIVLYIFYCLSVSFFEESVFCGIIFPLSLIALKGKKNRLFWSVALANGVFAISHIVNIFSGGVGATFLQIGYTFLIGSMCCISKCITENIFSAISIHFIYDIGGLMTDTNIGIASGARWNTLTIVITAIIGVIVCIYMIFMLLRLKEDGVKCLYMLDKDEEKTSENGGDKV